MQVEVTNIDDCSKKLKIKIPSEKVSQEYENLIKKVSSAARIKGFRQGKAPKNLVKVQYKDAIESDLLKAMVPEACEKAIKDENLEIIGNYMLEDYIFQEGDPLELVVAVEIKPNVNLTGYKDIKVERKEVKVEDEDIEKTIERLREEHAELKPIEDRPAKEGDEVVFDFSLSVEGEESVVSEKESKASLGKKELMEELEKGMIGMKSGEEKDISVTYPEEHNQKDLAGKKALFKIKLKEIHERVLPEINDEFAKDVGKYETFDELKNDITDKLTESKTESNKREEQQELINKLVELNPFSVPKSLVENEAKGMIQNWENNLKRMGKTIAELEKEEVRHFVEDIKKEAEKTVKLTFLCEKIASVEKVEVEEKEVDEEISKHAEVYKKDFAQLKKEYENNGVLEYLKSKMLEEKVLNFLLGYSNI